MVQTSQVEKFDLWKTGNIALYYSLRDAELYMSCLKESFLNAIQESRNRGPTNSLPEKMEEINARLRERKKEIDQIFEELQSLE